MTMTFDEFFGSSAKPEAGPDKITDAPAPSMYARQASLRKVISSAPLGDEPVSDSEWQSRIAKPAEQPKDNIVSFEDFFGSPPAKGFKSDEPMPQWNAKDNFQQTLNETGSRITAAIKGLPRGIAQTGATLSDMILGAPGGLWKSSVYAGARAAGIPADEAEEYSNRLTPQSLMGPVQAVVNALDMGDGSEEQVVNKAMNWLTDNVHKGSQWLSDKTDGKIPPQDFENVATNLMSIAGVKGGQSITSKIIANAEKARQAGFEQKDVQQAPGQPERVEPTMGETPKAEEPLTIEIVGGKEGPLPPEVPVAGKPHLRPRSTPEQVGQVLDSVEPDVQSPMVRDLMERLKNPEAPNPTVDEILKAAQEGNSGRTAKFSHMEQLALGALAVGVGGWAYMNPEDADKLGVGGLMAAGAIKGKGGMWHPEAVTRLSDPLVSKLSSSAYGFDAAHVRQSADILRAYTPKETEANLGGFENSQIAMKNELKAMLPIVEWSDKTIRNYLNRHAGTATDPLKDVRIPMLGDDVRWEDVWDHLIKGETAQGPKGPEIQWKIDQAWEPPRMDQALHNYLSHVGDYLREFVPPDKLGQYDLVRAVKETAEQDRKMAEAMHKVQGYHSDKLVTNKDYGNGLSWKVVGENTELTPEMAATIKLAEHVDKDALRYLGWDKVGNPPKEVYQAYYPNGKPIIREADKSPVYGRTPLEAYNNGHLANEGNVMGHCVGGYCEAVHSGESRIFSLRDEKGMSHVTVEVEPSTSPNLPEANSTGYKPLSNIVQIKGKQNRAPVEKYLPYVQDFVRSGKWGEVGDIENAGLVDVHQHFSVPEIQNLVGNGQRYISGEELRKRLHDPDVMGVVERMQQGGKQSGKVDPRLLTGIAAVGTGAALGYKLADPDSKAVGAALGALAGLGISRRGRDIPGVRAVENGLKISLNQTLRRLNPDAIGPEFEKSSAILASHYVKQIQAEVEQGVKGAERKTFFDKMPIEGRMSFLRGLEIPGVKYKDAALQKMHDYYRQWMKNIYEQDQAKGIKYEPEENYVYHVFKDSEGVSRYFEKKYGTQWGDPRFTKERKINTLKEAQEAGFELKYDNPEQIAQARQIASDIAAMKIDALREMSEAGLGRPVKKGMTASVDETTWRAPNGELYFMGDAANQILHNAFNSKSLWGDPGLMGMSYRGAMYMKNAILPIKLLSGFHALHVALGMITGTKAVNAIKGVASGDIGLGRALWDVGKSATLIDAAASLRYAYRDTQPRAMRAFRGEIPADKLTDLDKTQVLRAIEGGFSPEMAPEYRNNHIQAWKDAVTRTWSEKSVGQAARAVWQTPFAALQLAFTRPMFENWIPAVKWQAYQQSAAAALAAAPELAGDTLARKVALRKISKMIDDRFGEMNYKTNFMDRLTKDVGVASLLSYGWQAGFVRSYLGAVPEAWKAFTKGEEPLSRKIAQGKLDKTLFLSSYLTQTLLYGGLMTYGMTGTLPQGIVDYIFPRTGEKNKDGSPARVSTPFYTREFASVPYHMQKDGIVGGLATTIGNKINPAYGMMKGILFNKDYFNRAISTPGDPLVTQVLDRAGWVGHEMAPMAVTAPERGTGSAKEKVLSAAGFAPAPKYATLPEADPQLLKQVRGEQRKSAEARKRAKDPDYDLKKEYKRLGITP